ncbi:MAG: FeoB-associated Cys-rich membrane protein [Muribaculaceae bacterium]|nr:FeoB-associated Cys-rich membrane protein [Muribaculaceae bacterium]
MSIVLQWSIVAIIILAALFFAIRSFTKSSNDPCCNCPSAKSCNKKVEKELCNDGRKS